jgi:hypothetical protein
MEIAHVEIPTSNSPVADGLHDLGFRANFAIAADLASKDTAGYQPSLPDAYGRLLSYQLLHGNNGGVSDTLSSITALSNICPTTSHI